MKKITFYQLLIINKISFCFKKKYNVNLIICFIKRIYIT